MGNNSQALIAIAQQITAAMTAGNTPLASQLAGIFHMGASSGHVDYKAKTITMSWASNRDNQAALPILESEGFTIIPD